MHCIWHFTHDLWHLNTLSNSSVYYISYQLYISDNTSTASVYSHPDYRSYNPNCVYDNTGKICMTSLNTYDITSTLYDITPRYDFHIHCIHVITPRTPVIASTVAELLLTVYGLENVCNMYDIKPLYIWHHMNSMWYHNHFYWHQRTVFMTSYPQYSWIQNRLYTT